MKNYPRLAIAATISALLMGCGPEDVSNIDAANNTETVSNTGSSMPAENNPYVEMDAKTNTQAIDYSAGTNENSDSIITDETKAKGMAMFGAGVDAAVAGINSIDKSQLEDIKTSAINKVDGAVKNYQASGNTVTSGGTTNFDNTWKTATPSGVRVIDGDTIEIKVIRESEEMTFTVTLTGALNLD